MSSVVRCKHLALRPMFMKRVGIDGSSACLIYIYSITLERVLLLLGLFITYFYFKCSVCEYVDNLVVYRLI